jgi:TonB family protein
MNDSGKVVLATVLSAAMHILFFATLALMPGASAVPATEPSAAERPLEVTLESSPALPQPPEPPEPLEAMIAGAPLPHSGAMQTQIDPENLKKAEHPPEHPTAIAAHDSQAASGKSAAPAPSPTPFATPMPEAAPALTLAPASASKPEGEVGIDALGNYGKAVGNAIGIRSEYYRQTQKHTLAVGEVRLKFTLDAQGRVSEIVILSNTAGAANAVCAEQAVREAHIPAIPPERLAQVPGGRIQIVYTFTIYHP